MIAIVEEPPANERNAHDPEVARAGDAKLRLATDRRILHQRQNLVERAQVRARIVRGQHDERAIRPAAAQRHDARSTNVDHPWHASQAVDDLLIEACLAGQRRWIVERQAAWGGLKASPRRHHLDGHDVAGLAGPTLHSWKLVERRLEMRLALTKSRVDSLTS
jgi:hypothetical protein